MTKRQRTPWQHVIGIVGGLGPFAHIELERQLLVATAKRLGRAPSDQDFPEWVASSMPETPDRTKALLGQGPSPVPWLEQSVRRLCCVPGAGGADFAVIACNTAHAFLDEVRERVRIPIMDMIGETVREACRQVGQGGTIGILGTTGTVRAGLYPAAAWRVDSRVRVISPLDVTVPGRGGAWLQEHLVMEPIYGPKRHGERTGGGIKSGLVGDDAAVREAKERAAAPLREAARLLGRAGADLCVLACTEIPLALGREPVDGVALLDPVQVVAAAAIAVAAGDRPLPETPAGALCAAGARGSAAA